MRTWASGSDAAKLYRGVKIVIAAIAPPGVTDAAVTNKLRTFRHELLMTALWAARPCEISGCGHECGRSIR
jgi:hypothetical protein